MSRAAAVLQRANHRLFAHFGEQAVLRGAEPVTVVPSQTVGIQGEYGQIDRLVTTATFHLADAPRARDPLHILTGPAAGVWRLDEVVKRDGGQGVIEWILVPAVIAP
jgi:hypothetical protein